MKTLQILTKATESCDTFKAKKLYYDINLQASQTIRVLCHNNYSIRLSDATTLLKSTVDKCTDPQLNNRSHDYFFLSKFSGGKKKSFELKQDKRDLS